MALLRTTFFFKQLKWGWSETYFSTRATLVAALADAVRLLPLRNNLNGINASCEYIRVSDDEVKRDSLIHAVPLEDQKGRNNTLGSSDIPNTCLVTRLQASPLGRRTLSMRGIPDEVVIAGGQYSPAGPFLAGYGAWRTEIVSGSWGVRLRGSPAPALEVVSITNNSADLYVTYITPVAHGFVYGDIVNITGTLPAKELRGLHKIIAVPTPLSFRVFNRVNFPLYTGGAVVKKNTYSVAAISDAFILRASHRIAGRPFDSPRGRR